MAAPPLWRPGLPRARRRCRRCGLPVRNRAAPSIRPPWREPIRPRWNPAGPPQGPFPRRLDPQANILTLPLSNVILTDAGGTIIDDASPDPSCCCGCPDCYIPNERSDPKCRCIETRLLAVVSGCVISCSCTDFTCPPGSLFANHFKTGSPIDCDGSYCFGGVADPAEGKHIAAFGPMEIWGNDSPSNDCDGASLIDTGDFVSMNCSTAHGINEVEVEATITAQCVGGTAFFNVFHGHLLDQDCDGPWVLHNLYSPGCYNLCAPDPAAGQYAVPAGVIVTVYPCGC